MIVFLGLLAIVLIIYEYEKRGGVADIANYAGRAGFSGVDLVTAVAIAYAESAGDPNAVGDLDLGRSIGLWQINLRAHPEYTEEYLLNPQNNAFAAFQIYRDAGYSFHPWSTFKSGAYLSHVDKAQSEIGDSFEIASETPDMEGEG